MKEKEQLEGQPSTERRRLIEIDETIEALHLAIDYQNNVISKRERDVQQSIRTSQVKYDSIVFPRWFPFFSCVQGIDSPLFKISQLNENESKELCRKLFEKVIDLKDEDEKLHRDYEQVQVITVSVISLKFILVLSSRN